MGLTQAAVGGNDRRGAIELKQKSFEGATRIEAERLAADWIRSQRGIRITHRRATIAIGGDGTGTKLPTTTRPPDRWTIVLEYEDGSYY